MDFNGGKLVVVLLTNVNLTNTIGVDINTYKNLPDLLRMLYIPEHKPNNLKLVNLLKSKNSQSNFRTLNTINSINSVQ